MATSKANPNNKRVCTACVREEYLHAEITKIGKRDTCSYCGKRGKTITTDILADYVDGAFERHYYRTPSGPNDFEYMMYKEGDVDWERDGEPAQYAIANAAMMDDAIGEDVREILEDRHYDHEEAKAGGEGEFDVESH